MTQDRSVLSILREKLFVYKDIWLRSDIKEALKGCYDSKVILQHFTREMLTFRF